MKARSRAGFDDSQGKLIEKKRDGQYVQYGMQQGTGITNDGERHGEGTTGKSNNKEEVDSTRD